MPRITITIAAMSVGMKESIIPNIWLMLSRPSAVLASRITTSITSQKISLASARTGSSREPVRPTTSSSPPAAAIRLKSSSLERVVGPALHLPRQEVAGQQDDGRADERGQDRADLFGSDEEAIPEFVHDDTSITSFPVCSPRCIR